MKDFENLDLENITTPVDADMLERLLTDSNYDAEETDFVVNGFRTGFALHYEGPTFRQDYSDNIPFTVGNKFVMWEKIMKEVKLGRYAGPFREPPFTHFIQSPIGLVPKAGGDTRLIFHLSYKFKNGNESVNYWTPKHLSSVKYNDIEHAVRNALRLVNKHESAEGIFAGKSDLVSAFRVLPLSADSWKWLLIKAKHPVTDSTVFFVDKNLPFGSRISCAHFQKVSNCIRHLTEHAAGRRRVITNYLDDFLFIDITKVGCNFLVDSFLEVCHKIQFPVSVEKTVWATRNLVFLGILLLGRSLHLSVCTEKRDKAVHMLTYLMEKRKATVNELERLAGFLNFLNKAIVPGRSFTRRMYAKFAGIVKINQRDGVGRVANLRKYHHVSLDAEFRYDCRVWLIFLQNTQAVCRPFVDLKRTVTADSLFFYSDASLNPNLGFGCVFNHEWSFGKWEPGFVVQCEPSIGFLELYAACIGIFTWGHLLRNGRFLIWIDNTAARDMINQGSSKCPNCMYLLKMLTLNNLQNNRRVFARYVNTKVNFLSDALSRLRIDYFLSKAPKGTKRTPQALPNELWPLSRVWQNKRRS